jgi:hypothetical protein
MNGDIVHQTRRRQQQIQPKLSTIFKEIVKDTNTNTNNNSIHQVYGSFISSDGHGYCAFSALVRYLGHEIKLSTPRESQYPKKDTDENCINRILDLIPYNILEMVEDFSTTRDFKKEPLECFRSCPKPAHYFYSMLSLLIHLNDYHKMTFTQIGTWLESKGM